jgi:hypothetical protein
VLVGICGQAGSGKSTVAQFLVKHHGFIELGLADPLKRFVQDVFDFTNEQVWGPSEFRNAEDKRYIQKEVCDSFTCPCCGKSYPYPITNLVKCAGCGDVAGNCYYDEQTLKTRQQFLTPRYTLQTLGTEWGRNCYPQVWVDYAIRIHKKLQEGNYSYDQKRGLFPISFLVGPSGARGVFKPKTNVVISDVRFLNEVRGIKNAGGQVWHISRPGADGKVGVSGHASEEEQKSIPHELFDAGISNCSSIANLLDFVDNLVLLAKGK